MPKQKKHIKLMRNIIYAIAFLAFSPIPAFAAGGMPATSIMTLNLEGGVRFSSSEQIFSEYSAEGFTLMTGYSASNSISEGGLRVRSYNASASILKLVPKGSIPPAGAEPQCGRPEWYISGRKVATHGSKDDNNLITMYFVKFSKSDFDNLGRSKDVYLRWCGKKHILTSDEKRAIVSLIERSEESSW